MTPDQVKLVQDSFAKVAPISAKAAELFYGRLFEIAPQVRAMFPDDMTEQRKKLMATLAIVVNGLDQSRQRSCRRRAHSPSATSAMGRSPRTIRSSARRCCGRSSKASGRRGRRRSRPPGRRPTRRCPAS